MLKLIGLIVLLHALLPTLMEFLLRKEYPTHDPSECAVLMTGVSTGLGNHAAVSLAQDGYVVYGTVRKEADKEKFKHLKNLVPVMMDVAKSKEIDQAVKFVTTDIKKRKLKLCALVNNAGISDAQVLEIFDLNQARKMFDVNFFGVLELTQKMLPLLRASKGRIVITGSLAGLLSSPLSVIYSSTKFAIEALADGLRRELAHLDISVSLLQPGVIESVMVSNAASFIPRVRKGLESNDVMPVYESLLEKREKSIANYRKGMIWTPDQSSTPAIKHAIADKYPRTRYPVAGFSGLHAHVLKATFQLLPDRLADTVMNLS